MQGGEEKQRKAEAIYTSVRPPKANEQPEPKLGKSPHNPASSRPTLLSLWWVKDHQSARKRRKFGGRGRRQ
ncbi:hypothetical protein ZHAS_00013178 [Anopheles sinensis]|uniref:Uncharacterized protein n=1 Tax=Anopheles sinensis TaxID=74873 RepID=A0A084W4R8_ANOSI|nr:hypothetical protein ZHAS_00013178 [Anopheles sinensis]